jgi:hypothetical protein
MIKTRLTTEDKALAINLRPDIYGSFAEIGAGQEVAANFFKAGGSSGTIAYTHSAYDMKVSDAMYGECGRYVCEDRLKQMLTIEYSKMQTTLPNKNKEARFFTFADTVESLNYHKTNQGQGWVGIKFQLNLEKEANEVILHVKMHDNSHHGQREALGILGVNLIHACYNHSEDINDFLEAISYRLPRDRMEIDMLNVSGPDFENADNRIIALNLVKNGLTDATMFNQAGHVLQPSAALYKKNVLLMRGRFRPVTKVNIDMLTKGLALYENEEGVDKEKIQVLFELTLKDLTADGEISVKDFIYRAELLCSMGYTVMISNYLKHYKMIEYLTDITRGYKLGVILGIYNLQTIFDEKYYDTVKGGLLEAFGRGFGRNVKMYVYPAFKANSKALYSVENFELPEYLEGLLDYMKKSGKIESITDFNESLLHIISDNVLAKIKASNSSWENDVPHEVMKAIKFFELFDYKAEKIVKTET